MVTITKMENIYYCWKNNPNITSRVFSFLFKSVIVNNNWNPNNYDKNNDWIVKDKIDRKIGMICFQSNLKNEINKDV